MAVFSLSGSSRIGGVIGRLSLLVLIAMFAVACGSDTNTSVHSASVACR